MGKKGYTGIDYFRVFAALLVIAIHTSPLLSFSETGDFVLTRIAARIAVPFFFMTTGFFLISRYQYNANKLKVFIKKTAIIYSITIAGYIPLNIYNGYFKMDYLLPNMIKDIVFDGTLYHLWYLPASMIGAAIAWFLVKRVGLREALVITAILYIVGLFGDSYYGFAEQLPLIKNIYDGIFQVSDYTRNGIFFAPVFLVLGGVIADKSIYISLKNCLIGFGLSFSLMLGEGMILHNLEMQRHDSMYIMLLPCMYFLFTAFTFFKGRRTKILRTAALMMYMIHPMIIVAVRMFAKALQLQSILVENSLVHYFVVCIFSGVASLVIMWILEQLRHKPKVTIVEGKDRAWIEINKNHLRHNVKILQKAMLGNCELMAVVKAEAYGHGAFEVATCVNQMGVKAFAVATIDEGIELRRYGIQGEILIMGYTNPMRAQELRKYNLTQTLVDYTYAVDLNRQGYDLKAHIKIDTGMHRLGFEVNDVTKVSKIFRAKHLNICGMYTHLCVADSHAVEDEAFTKRQISSFYHLIEILAESGIKIPKIHIQSSYGFLNYPELKCDYVRAGVSLYGVLSSPGDETKLKLDLRPVLSLKSKIILIRKIRRGESVGYGRMFVADKDSVIAILPVGYADGIPRNLSCGKGEVIVQGYRVPVVGRICMDQLVIDITDIPNIMVGDIVTLIGKDGTDELVTPNLAEQAESISNEFLSRMGTRLNRNLQ